ncbi:hypothetical protein [Acinetobacter baumannii]|uniref:hypothetical protein n=1 Tax=Acinetobacter baumannii TaxID=470 RepID=UPI000BF963A2|nr:hypothetical protein [Acinetobacter baumannii]MDC5216123.1 hypothetical protein [Acinetobacter baumannii]WCS39653.1 hypothetical protein OSV60_07505 [Acinetobacter baumannii]
MANYPNKEDLISSTVTEAQFKEKLGDFVDTAAPKSFVSEYVDPSLYAPLHFKDNFESGYLETFFDSYKTINQYVPARYSSGFAQIGAGTAIKRIPISSGLSIRFKTKYLATAPLMILGLTDSPNAFVSANNIGVVTGNSLTNAFHFRLPGGSQPVASTLVKEDLYNNTFYMELLVQGNSLTLNRYSDNFESLIETFTETVDRSEYETYRYLILYTQQTTYFSSIEINYFNAKAEFQTNAINPSWFNTAQSYLLNDWSRRTNTNSSAYQSLGRDGQLSSKAMILEVDIDVDINNTTDGFIIGFGNTATSADRVAVGYEPAVAYRGLVFFAGGVFTKIAPIESLVSGLYKLVLSKNDTKYRYQVRSPDGLLIVDSEYENAVSTSRQLYISGKYTTASKTLVKDVRLTQGISLDDKRTTSSSGGGFKDLTGRNLVQEQFGGEGNDWSFVYTPESYSITGKPHGLVILNHGNGWAVSSNPSTANFSGKTQFGVDTQNEGTYLDTNRADYVQYSSPLIEALLAEGYVVCGATNYADKLYGNKNCRNAVVDFYNYMRKNYNVTDRCHMIGASNGGMTTLNACHLLGTSKVASIALLYPLASLFDHYLAYSAHRDEIRAAYGVSANTYPDLAALKAEETFYTHCPVHHFIVGDDLTEQQIKTLALPPMFVVSSSGDSVTAAASNGKKLKDLCDRSGLICEYTDIDPDGSLGYEHGHWQHFKEAEIINFFLVNK